MLTRFALTGLICLLALRPAFGQDPTGTIEGRVVDDSDAALPGAVVIATHLDTGVSKEAVSGDDPRSATQALAAAAGIQVVAVATRGDLLAFAGESADLVAQREPLQAYRARYGCRTGAAS